MLLRVLTQRLSARSVTLIGFESALIVSAIAVAAYLRLGVIALDVAWNENVIGKALLVAAVTQTCLYYCDLYDLRLLTDRRELSTRIVQALSSASFILAVLYFWFPALIIGRGVFLIAAVLVLLLVSGWRITFEWLSGRIGPRERLLLVGTTTPAVALAREMYQRRHELGVEIVGFVDADPALVGTAVINPGVIGTIEDIPSIVRARNVDRVVVSLADARGRLPMQKLLHMKLEGVTTFDHLATVYEEYTGKIALENLRPSWLIFSSGFRKTRPLVAAKRLMDVVASGAGLIVLSPLMLLIA